MTISASHLNRTNGIHSMEWNERIYIELKSIKPNR